MIKRQVIIIYTKCTIKSISSVVDQSMACIEEPRCTRGESEIVTRLYFKYAVLLTSFAIVFFLPHSTRAGVIY